MPTTDRKLRVFLCHASQDKPIVRELRQRLADEGWIEPWLDEKKILPGEDWRTSIELAVESSDLVMICLSNNSINKEGFVQKELRYAREISLEKPEGTIFLIPLRLDECDVPRGLRFFQWTDYFGEHRYQAYSELLDSFRIRRQQVIRLEEEKERREAEELIKKQREEIARKEAEERARREAEELARVQVEILTQKLAEEKVSKNAEKQAHNDALEKIWKETYEKARKEAEDKARDDLSRSHKKVPMGNTHRNTTRKNTESKKYKSLSNSRFFIVVDILGLVGSFYGVLWAFIFLVYQVVRITSFWRNSNKNDEMQLASVAFCTTIGVIAFLITLSY